MNEPAPATSAIHAHATRTVSGWEFSQRTRRWVLAAHVTLTCVWLGASIVTLLLVGVQQLHPVAAWRAGLDRAVLLVHDALIVNASYGFVLTGLLFSLFTSWGAFRLRWIALKWVLLGVLGAALPLWVAPHVSAMSAWSHALSGEVAGHEAYAEHARAVLLAAGTQIIVLGGIVALSVFKPWGQRKALRPWPRPVPLGIAAALIIALAGNLWLQNVELESYRQLPVTVVDVASLRDGTYLGEETQSGFTFRVRVNVADGSIARVDVLSNFDSHYARLATLAAAKLEGRRRNDVDAISGATTTSKALLRAVSNALRNAPRKEAGQ